jgi:ACR3 family arsenite efflux pump ArsB
LVGGRTIAPPYLETRELKFHATDVAAPGLIGASNFFELAVATAF